MLSTRAARNYKKTCTKTRNPSTYSQVLAKTTAGPRLSKQAENASIKPANRRPSSPQSANLQSTRITIESFTNQHYEAQISHHQLLITTRTLQWNLSTHADGASLFKKVKSKALKPQTKKARKNYGEEHFHHTIQNFWQYVNFTDEKHVDPGQVMRERILRKPGTAFEQENVQEMPNFQGITLHLATSISWHHKGRLQWYNDEKHQPEVTIPAQKKELKPRKNMYKSLGAI